ncbi:unnamed protein product [Meloidogyne enterolobii]|uniref:Uncharacterized protein n=1 Tax=Meloidogyne enterolobii TaxID=390850 RepID=A0ACB1AKH6_MELEN
MSARVRPGLSVRLRPCFVSPCPSWFVSPSPSVFCQSVFVRVLSVRVRPCFVSPSSSDFCQSESIGYVCPCVCFVCPQLNMPQVKRVELNEEEKNDHYLYF